MFGEQGLRVDVRLVQDVGDERSADEVVSREPVEVVDCQLQHSVRQLFMWYFEHESLVERGEQTLLNYL